MQQISTLNRINQENVDIRGVSPRTFDAVFPEYMRIGTEANTDTDLSLSERMYTANGGSGMMISSAMDQELGISIDDEILVEARLRNQDRSLHVRKCPVIHIKFHGSASRG